MQKNYDYYIYYIMLENDKFFVTNYKTNLITVNDIKTTSALVGPDWLLINRPIGIIKKIKNDPKFTMEDYVINFMSIEGIKNVRGGPYCNIYISPESETCILRKINTTYIPITCGDYAEESESETSSNISTSSKSSYIAKIYRWFCFKNINNDDSKEIFEV